MKTRHALFLLALSLVSCAEDDIPQPSATPAKSIDLPILDAEPYEFGKPTDQTETDR